jgi:O-antigen/teichoic acid export membrane protein
MLVAPILTRLYTPSEFAILTVYVSLLTLDATISMRYEQAIPLQKDDKDAMNMLALCMGVVCFMSLLYGVIAFVGKNLLAQWLKAPEIGQYIWLLPLSLLGIGCYNALNYWNIRKQEYKRIGATKLGQGIGQSVTQVGLGFLHIGPVGLLIGDVIGRASGAGNMLRKVWSEDRALLHEVSFAGVRDLAIRFKQFPLYATSAALLHSAATAAPMLLFTSYYGKEVAGQYGLGQRVIWGPMTFLGIAVAQVWFGKTSDLIRNAPEKLEQNFHFVVKRLLVIGAVPCLLGLFTGRWVFAVVFGAKWAEAGTFAQILCLTWLIQFVVGPLFNILNALERQSWLFLCDLVGVVLIVGSLNYAHQNLWSPRSAMMLLAVAIAIMYVGLLVATAFAIRLHVKRHQAQGATH